MTTAYLGLGSNLGNRLGNLKKAREQLSKLEVNLLKKSAIYESEPVFDRSKDATEPWFLNQVLRVETDLGAHELLKVCKKIEADLGRDPDEFSRPIDIDILFYGDEKINESGLEIPHPRLYERRFVLEPLVEIAPQFAPLLKECPDSARVRLL